MNTAAVPTRDALPLVGVAAALTGTALLALALGWSWVSGRAEQSGLVYGVAVVWGLNLLSLPVVRSGLRRGPQVAASLFLAASGGRMVLAMSAALLGVVAFDLPPRPTLLAIAGAYLPLLAVEVVFVYRATLADATSSDRSQRDSRV